MTGLLIAVAVWSGATPQSSSRTVLNLEPIVVGAVGLVGVGLGAWRLAESDAAVQDLQRLVRIAQGAMEEMPKGCENDRTTSGLLGCGRGVHQRGTMDGTLGVSLLALGGVLLAGSIVWLLVEGVTQAPVVAAPAIVPGGGAVVLQARF